MRRRETSAPLTTPSLVSTRLASIVDSSDDAIVSKDLDGRIRSWNAAATRIFGYTANEMIGQSITRIIPPELHAQEMEILAQLSRGERIDHFETVRVAKDGRRFDMAITASPLRDKSGKVVGASKIGRDITERKQTDRTQLALRIELARVSRLTTMGELTASIAHEIAQPLSAVITNGNTCLYWLEDKTFDLANARAAAARTVRDAERTNDIMRRIRGLMTRSEVRKTDIDVNEIIRQVLELIKYEVQKRQVSVHTELAATLPAVLGDQIQLQQLMLNLIMNGVEAMAPVANRPKELIIETRVEASDHVAISVRDSGEGLDQKKVEQIFDAFFTTKTEGMGIGLSICRSIVEAHDGRIWASPNIPHGAVLHVTLPTKTAENS